MPAVRNLPTIFLALVVVIAIFFWWLYHSHFPRQERIEATFVAYKVTTSNEQSAKILGDLLRDMSDPQSAEESYAVVAVFKRLASLFLGNHDESILDAVDATDAWGGFANDLCGFYSQLKENPVFCKRYLSGGPKVAALERCLGITWNREGIDALRSRCRTRVKEREEAAELFGDVCGGWTFFGSEILVQDGNGKIAVQTKPWSKVYLDGKYIGNTPMPEYEVRAGSHNIRVENKEYGVEREYDVVVEKNETTVLVKDLFQKEETRRRTLL
jgi:hypothetical protein